MIPGVLVLLVAASAPSLALEWRSPAGCPPREAFLQELRRLRGEVLEAGVDEAEVAVQVTVVPTGASWQARVETRSKGGLGRRALEADTCAHAVDAAAVVVSLALADPLAPLTLPPEAPAPAPEAVPLPPPAPRWTFALGLTGGVRAGLIDPVAPGASVAAALSRGPLRLEATLTTPFVSNVSQGAVQAEIAAWLSGRVAGCWEFGGERLSLGPCLLLHFAWLGGRGTGGLETTTSGNGGYLAGSAGLLGRVRLASRLWARLDVSGGAALMRPRFVTTLSGSVDVVAAPRPWLVDANLGLEWRFE